MVLKLGIFFYKENKFRMNSLHASVYYNPRWTTGSTNTMKFQLSVPSGTLGSSLHKRLIQRRYNIIELR